MLPRSEDRWPERPFPEKHETIDPYPRGRGQYPTVGEQIWNTQKMFWEK